MSDTPDTRDAAGAVGVPSAAAAPLEDAAQEFAERVADSWFDVEDDQSDWRVQYQNLVTLIANELRAGGWEPGNDVSRGRVTEAGLAEMRRIFRRDQAP